ncbi:hypothetical protein ECO9570_03037, partial [Escherichia coli O111:H8 str. CVM9570]
EKDHARFSQRLHQQIVLKRIMGDWIKNSNQGRTYQPLPGGGKNESCKASFRRGARKTAGSVSYR